MKKAVVLFSGGLDSTTCLALAKAAGFDCYALSIEYGQKHSVELEASRRLVKQMGVVEQKIITLQLNGSSLTDADSDVKDFEGSENIPSTYVPARNTIFLSLALGWAEVINAFDIYIGANIMDYSGYPDCRPEFLHAFENVANLGTKVGIEGKKFTIHSPLLKMTKADIIQTGMKLSVDYGATISCYRADAMGRACGKCESCTYRKKGFAEAGVADPTRYV